MVKTVSYNERIKRAVCHTDMSAREKLTELLAKQRELRERTHRATSHIDISKRERI